MSMFKNIIVYIAVIIVYVTISDSGKIHRTVYNRKYWRGIKFDSLVVDKTAKLNCVPTA